MTWTCSTGVFGWVEVVAEAAGLRVRVVERRVVAVFLRDAGLRPAGLLLLVAMLSVAPGIRSQYLSRSQDSEHMFVNRRPEFVTLPATEDP